MASKTRIIQGKALAKKILDGLKPEVETFVTSKGYPPKLVPILVGSDPASEVYLKRKTEAAKKIGIDCTVLRFNETTTEESVISEIHKLNEDPLVHGIIVQLPLPLEIREKEVCERINTRKDVDGFGLSHLGQIIMNPLQSSLIPCTPLAVLKIIQSLELDLVGKKAVVVGRSHNVGMPIALLLAGDQIKGGLDMTTTICHRSTPSCDLEAAVKEADVVVSAVGKPGLIRGDMIKRGAVVIDVGITRVVTEDNSTKLLGDVDPLVLEDGTPDAMTPVPGGVGPCTVACLLHNTVRAAYNIDMK
uniref:Bifunctional methylenetetrahydrofolate dehydrogenase/cyclohydrolase, mitochondrial n=1 Tax=Caligus clemensi TaxID=344056 RepID=C1C1D0_CALCM|nr:Bifunctional methylenetetrahydrofolate dehydrogenase/cyclohydrolase, mitochondrial precursor [Caligus clemensi]